MKAIKKLLAVALALTMLLALCACSKDNADNNDANDTAKPGTTQNTNTGTTASYEVTVLDGQGTPITSGVVVKFMKNGEQIAMQNTNDKGVAIKELDKGDYTVELMFTDSSLNASYDTSAAVLSADKTTLTLTLINEVGSETQPLFVGDKEFAAHFVDAGSTNVPVIASERNYFIFAPTVAGTYTFSVSNSDVKIGYYGAPHFVQAMSAMDVIDNVITMSISASSIGGSYVIGLDGLSTDTKTVLNIIRIGDPEITISDMPWTDYKTTHTPSPYTLDLGGKSLKFIDITGQTANVKLVYNANDGFYHCDSENGPVMLVQLGKKAPYISLQTVIEGDGLGGGAPIREYFYDANGEFLKKEDYTDILQTYFKNMDANYGVYPLTKDLEYIIKNGCNGWWDKNSPDYIFTDCNPEIGWMFALCYVG